MRITIISSGFAGRHVVKVVTLHTNNDVLETKNFQFGEIC
jgi:hypothetical protein